MGTRLDGSLRRQCVKYTGWTQFPTVYSVDV
jgi:hypothetical protein